MTQLNRDRPAKNPGGMQCERCDEIFIGEEWHAFCAICVKEVADEIAQAQGITIKTAQDKPMPNGPAGDAGQAGWMGGEFDR